MTETNQDLVDDPGADDATAEPEQETPVAPEDDGDVAEGEPKSDPVGEDDDQES